MSTAFVFPENETQNGSQSVNTWKRLGLHGDGKTQQFENDMRIKVF